MYLNASILFLTGQFNYRLFMSCSRRGATDSVHDSKFNQVTGAQSSGIVRKYRDFAPCFVGGGGDV
jgi:hypothetical protein